MSKSSPFYFPFRRACATDISEGMLETAHANIGDFPNIRYRAVDIQEMPFAANSFDMVIANMMLYHVPDLGKGLSEVARILKEDGKFYCATGGERGIWNVCMWTLRREG